jgi:hypothetical protein
MITEDKAIEAIKEKIEQLNKVQVDSQFYSWRKATIGTLKRVVPYNETIFKNLESITITTPFGGDYSQRGKQEASLLLENLINDISRFGLEEATKLDKNEDKLKVIFNQQNQQTQTTTVSINIDFIVEVLKGELRASEIEKLKEILESDLPPKEKKKNFMEKIKSFGNDVASNILANILTNPAVYEQINKLF